MIERFPGITQQVDFPTVDLTEENAAVLELRLANREILERVHSKLSWQTVFIDHVDALTSNVGRNMWNDPEEWQRRRDAFMYGANVFGAMLGCVDAHVLRADSWLIKRIGGTVLDYTRSDRNNLAQQGISDIGRRGRRTVEVVTGSAERFYPDLTTHALLGASIFRKITLDIDRIVAEKSSL